MLRLQREEKWQTSPAMVLQSNQVPWPSLFSSSFLILRHVGVLYHNARKFLRPSSSAFKALQGLLQRGKFLHPSSSALKVQWLTRCSESTICMSPRGSWSTFLISNILPEAAEAWVFNYQEDDRVQAGHGMSLLSSQRSAFFFYISLESRSLDIPYYTWTAWMRYVRRAYRIYT